MLGTFPTAQDMLAFIANVTKGGKKAFEAERLVLKILEQFRDFLLDNPVTDWGDGMYITEALESSPEHKQSVIEKLKSLGYIVTMQEEGTEFQTYRLFFETRG